MKRETIHLKEGAPRPNAMYIPPDPNFRWVVVEGRGEELKWDIYIRPQESR